MYALSFLKEGKRSNLDRDYSDDDNEVIGQVVHNTAEGMPIRLVDVDNDDKEKGDEIIILKETPIANTGDKFIKTDHSFVVPPTRTSSVECRI